MRSAVLVSLACGAAAFRGALPALRRSTRLSAAVSRPDFVTTAAAGAAGAALTTLGGAPSAALAANRDAAPTENKPWKRVSVPVQTTLFDIDFDTDEPDHGYCIGAKGTFLETTDGGKTWAPRSFTNLDAEEEINYRFSTISFKGGEVWIVGKPPILLHSKDAGKSWERVPLSPKLPGDVSGIVALGPATAEMSTTTGAVYLTTNAGRNWKAQVKETIDATLNRVSSSGVTGASYFTGSVISILRDRSGSYLAVSARGNFYLTWSPGSDFWVPHNRASSRRIQAMGFVNDDSSNGLWMSTNGGALQVTGAGVDMQGTDDLNFKDTTIKTGGYGIIDVAWKSEKEAWAVGGGGTMYRSTDGGTTFNYNDSADDIPGNLYSVKFFEGKDGKKKGFVLGSEGVLLRYAV